MARPLRERIAFEIAPEVALATTRANRPTRYSEMRLRAYPAAGYTLVTQDGI